SGGKISIHTFDAGATETKLTGLDKKYGQEYALVYFSVLAFRGKVSNASIEGASQTVNTRNMVSTGPFDELMKNPVIKAFVGSENFDVYSIKGFICLELLSGLTLYIIIYFLIQYAGAFSAETENKTFDLILSTPLSRRRLFLCRYLAWAVMSLILIAGWIIFIYCCVHAIGEDADVPLFDLARTMILFLPFILSVQGLCMLASVVTNQSRKAYGISFGIYYGMYFLRIVALLSERFNFVKYLTIFNYWDHNTIFIDGIVPWGNIILLTVLAVVLLIAGIAVFERKDLA
ncbi:MAG: ABC transporter permease, partial [Planctomycetota bacterium]